MTYSVDFRSVVDDVLSPSFGRPVDPDRQWRTVSKLGWHRIGTAQDCGGAGGDLFDLAELAAGAGRHAQAVPVLETALSAWILSRAGQSAELLGDDPAITVVVPGSGRNAPGAVLRDIRFLPTASHVVVLPQDGELLLVRRADLDVTVGHDLADEPVGEVVVGDLLSRGVPIAMVPRVLVEQFTARSALLRAAALGGCVERAAALVGQHVAVREQFGRPLISQQAVAHGVATIACERDMIVQAVLAALAHPTQVSFAAARATAARSASDAARVAHQLMGAMGITREHPLQLLTRRIWAWRDAEGTQRAWEERVGSHVVAGRADEHLWDLIAGESSSSIAT